MSKPNSIFIDGVEYVRVLQTPVVGMHDYVEERQRFILFLTGEAYDYINALPNSTFKASNDYEIKVTTSSSQLSEQALILHRDSFCEKRVELYDFFHDKKSTILTKEMAAKIKFALTELATKVPPSVRKPKKDPNSVWDQLEQF